MDKFSQRAEIQRRIKALSPAYCRTADLSIFRRILALPEYTEASCIFCYVSTEKEINTRPLIEDAWNHDKRVAVPKCISNGIMEIFEIHSWEDLETGSYQILEPKASCTPIAPSEIDFAIIPCVSCDRQKNRLGHGGGYYDRYLRSAAFPCAAVCREKLMLRHVCHEPHDYPIDMVISESAIY